MDLNSCILTSMISLMQQSVKFTTEALATEFTRKLLDLQVDLVNMLLQTCNTPLTCNSHNSSIS